MSPNAIRGSLEIPQLRIKKPFKKTLPDTLTPFQLLWKNRIAIKAEITAREALSPQQAIILEQGTAQIQSLGEAIQVASCEAQAANAAVEQHTQARQTAQEMLEEKSQKIVAATEMLKPIQTQIATLVSALEAFDALPVIPATQTEQVAAARERRTNLEQKVGLVIDALAATQNTINTQLKPAIAGVDRALPELREQASHLDARVLGLRTDKGAIEQQLEPLRKEVEGLDAKLGKLRSELGTVDASLGRHSIASLAVATSSYPTATLEDLNLLIEAQKLVRDELLPMLEEGTETHGQYTAELATIGQKIETVKTAIYNKQLEADLKLIEEQPGWAVHYLKAKLDPKFAAPVIANSTKSLEIDLQLIEQAERTIDGMLQAWATITETTDHAPALARKRTLAEARKIIYAEKTMVADMVRVNNEDKGSMGANEAPIKLIFNAALSIETEEARTKALDPIPVKHIQAAVEFFKASLKRWEPLQQSYPESAFVKTRIADRTKAIAVLEADLARREEAALTPLMDELSAAMAALAAAEPKLDTALSLFSPQQPGDPGKGA